MTWLNGYRMRLPFGSELSAELVLIGFITVGFLSPASICMAQEYTWTQKTDMPTPRWMPTSAAVNGKIYVIGGVSSEPNGKSLSTVEEYDPATDTWTRKADMPTPRGWIPPSSPVVNGKIYVIGGGDDVVWDLPTVEEYDPATDTWTRKADMPTPRWCLAACAVNGKIYAIGGAPNYYKGLSTVEVYDPVTDTWTRKADKPNHVWGLCADVVKGKIYAFGGRMGMGAGRIVEEYDPATDTWTRKGDMLISTSNMASVVLGNKICVIGGWEHSNSTPYTSVQEYDSLIDDWTQTAAGFPVPRSSLTACVLKNRIYAIGGTDRRHPCPATSTVYELTINLAVDFNGDGIVDSADLCIMVEYWGTDEPLCDIAPPPFGDGIVDVQDLVVLSEHLFEDVNDPTLVAHWPLDETEGMVVADSAGDNSGYALGDPIWQPDGGLVDGALQLDGVDDFISAPAVLNPADPKISSGFSVVAWVMGGVPGQVVLSQTGAANWLCTDSVEGCLMTELKASGRGAPGPLLSQTVITDGEWHRMALVWDGSYRHLYVDGAEIAKDAAPLSGLEDAYGGLYFGVGSTLAPATFFSGLIDDVRIYNRAVRP